MAKNRRIHFDEDIRLMLKVAKGDHAAYVILYKKYLSIVTSYLVSLNAHKSLVKDLTQEVFTLLWKPFLWYRAGDQFLPTAVGVHDVDLELTAAV